MQISKAEANLISLNFLQKRTGREFPVIEIKYENKGLYDFHPYISHTHASTLITMKGEKKLIIIQHRVTV